MPIANVEHQGSDSDSEGGYWPDTHSEDFWEEAFFSADSATNSPIMEPPMTPFPTPTTERLTRGQYIENAFLQHAEFSPPSPTKPRHTNLPFPQGIRGAGASPTKDGKSPAQRRDHESSEDEVAAMVTDTEPSPASSRQSTQFFINSRTTSMTSIHSQQSLLSSSSCRKRQTELRESPPPSPTSSSVKMRRIANDATQVRESGQSSGSDCKASARSFRSIHFPPPIEMDDIFMDSRGSQANPPASLWAPSPRKQPGNHVPAQVHHDPPESSTSQSVPVLRNFMAAVASEPSLGSDPLAVPVQDSMPPSAAAAPRGPFGVDLEPLIVAHDAETQSHIDRLHLSWGVQYELARGITASAWSWDDVTPKILNQLKGSDNEAAHKVVAIMTGVSRVDDMTSDSSIWQELEREQKAIMENRHRGLGLLDDGEWDGVANWYGGQVQQIARLEKGTSSKMPYVVRLERMEKRRSNRFARFLGSRRIFQLRISQELMMKDGDGIREFLLRKFILCGRVFVPFHSKEEGLYLAETDQNWEREADLCCGDQFRMAFDQFVDWHNPLHSNANQPMSKWSTRWALGLSTSIPAIEFEGKNMFFINDIWAEDWQGAGKPPAEKIMTDGCGFINGAALRLIYQRFKYRSSPIAVQGRIAGAKGLWVLHPIDQEPDAPPKIWIRQSQNKIHLPPFTELDRAHRIFDLVGPSRVSMPYHLSMQSILNLSHNGVGDHVFVDLMVDRLKEDVRQLTDWSRPNAMVFMWDAVNKAGHVAGTRAQRYASGTSRALGISGRDYANHINAVETDGDSLDLESPLHLGRNRFSGAPVSLYESALELIQSGFNPLECRYLYDKVKNILNLVIDTAVKKFRSPIPQSAEAFIIPDPTVGGVLKEGEIYFRSSKPLNDPVNGRYFDTLEGPVIVGRNPIRVPSDMQKVMAVNYPELSGYYDVAIFSTKGSRSLQSLLSGGDSDGDITLMIWDPSFLESFSNATYIPPPENLLSEKFERLVESVEKFGVRFRDSTPLVAQKEFQKFLLLGLADLKIGFYSIFHDVTVYTFGYGSELARYCAHMFETALDSAKTGLRVKAEVFKADRRKFDRPRPECMAPSSQANGGVPLRREISRPFILDVLVEAGVVQSRLHRRDYDDKLDKPQQKDPDLLGPYQMAKSRALLSREAGFTGFHTELEIIEQHVRDVQKAWPAARSPKKQSSPAKKLGNSSKGKDPYLLLAEKFAEHLPDVVFTSDVNKVKASFAYELGETFGFCVAFRDLCTIKAQAKGNMPLLQSFSEVMTIPSSALRALAQNYDDF